MAETFAGNGANAFDYAHRSGNHDIDNGDGTFLRVKRDEIAFVIFHGVANV